MVLPTVWIRDRAASEIMTIVPLHDTAKSFG